MILGLTGGIGSGKSVVARLLEMLGAAVFYSDIAAREIYYETAVAPQIKSLLGEEVYLPSGLINKGFISSKIFSDPQLLKNLNNIIHPAVGEKFKRFIFDNPNRLIVKESALLFEAKIADTCDKVLVIAANDDLRIRRVVERDGLTEEDVRKKMSHQLSQDEKIKCADFVIFNNETELLIPQVVKIYNQLCERL